jgi:hypothetical protein
VGPVNGSCYVFYVVVPCADSICWRLFIYSLYQKMVPARRHSLWDGIWGAHQLKKSHSTALDPMKSLDPTTKFMSVTFGSI